MLALIVMSVAKGQVSEVRVHIQATLPLTGRLQICIGFRPFKS